MFLRFVFGPSRLVCPLPLPGRGLLAEDFPYKKHRVLFIDLEKQTVKYAPGIVVPWNESPAGGQTSSAEIWTIKTLLLISDGHAAEGDGEVCLSAIESSLKGEIQVILHKGKSSEVASCRNTYSLHDDGPGPRHQHRGKNRHTRNAGLNGRNEGAEAGGHLFLLPALRWT
jgi:hypothetical protein